MPIPETLPLSNFLLAQAGSLLLLVAHLMLAALVLGTSLSVLGLSFWRREGACSRVARALAATLPGRGFSLLLFASGGILALWLHMMHLATFSAAAWLPFMLLLGGGLLVCRFFCWRVEVVGGAGPGLILVGLVGSSMLGLAYLAFFCVAGLLIMPEKWPFLAHQPTIFLSWSAVYVYLQFVALALALSGAVALIQAGRKLAGDALQSDRTARRFGLTLAVCGLAALGPLFLLDVFILPDLALAPGYLLSGGILLLAALLCALLPVFWPAKKNRGLGRALTAGVFCLFVLLSLNGVIARDTALAEYRQARQAGIALPEVKTSDISAPPNQEKVVKADEKQALSGQKVFEQVCSSCHAFDRRIVGPPLNEVLPKYAGKQAELEAFIRDPEKVNPEYPAMPDLDLAEDKIAAVASYLLERHQEGEER